MQIKFAKTGCASAARHPKGCRLLPKRRKNVYIHSALDWQKDDIEYTIASYVDDMSQELYEDLSNGKSDFLRDHKRFQEDITIAVLSLERVLEGRAERLEEML